MVHPDVRLDVDRRARRTWAGGGPGVGGNVLGGTTAGVAGPEAKAGAGDEDDEQADRAGRSRLARSGSRSRRRTAGLPGSLGRAPGRPGCAIQRGPGVQKTAPTVVLLGNPVSYTHLTLPTKRIV